MNKLLEQSGAKKKGVESKRKSRSLIFDFEQTNVSGETKGVGKAKRLFRQGGARVIEVDIDKKPKRMSGVTYRRLFFTFVDSQTVEIWATRNGDIFRIKVNGSIKPIKNQTNHVAAIAEIIGHLESGRKKFQAKLAKAKVKLPSTINKSRAVTLKHLETKYADLNIAIEAAEERLEEMTA